MSKSISLRDTISNEANNNSITTKARYWVGIGWIENMRPDWEEVIAGLFQYPYSYCVHDKDADSEGNPRPAHVHIIVAYGNTTSYKNVLALYRQLNAPNKQAFNTVFKIQNIRHMYDYIIHNTEDAKKKKKYQYSKDSRINGNGFDIGSYEQISQADKDKMVEELEDAIMEAEITNYRELYLFVRSNYDAEYRKILRCYSSHFERLCRGNWLHVHKIK